MSKPAIISRKQTKFETKLEVKKKKYKMPTLPFNVVTLAIYSNNNGIIIWLSVRYQNFFSFQNVTSPPHAVGVPYILTGYPSEFRVGQGG